MEFLSSVFKKTSPTQYTPVSSNAPPAEYGDRGLEFVSRLQTPQHERSKTFEFYIGRYLAGSIDREHEEFGLNSLINECMAHREVGALRVIFEHEDIKRLLIQGDIDNHGWETFVAAAPDSLTIEKLTLASVTLDSSGVNLLFEVLGRMPALQELSLKAVAVKTFFFLPDPPPLQIKTFNIAAGRLPDADEFSLPLKLLESCRPVRLSVVDWGKMPFKEHQRFGAKLGEQTALKSLRVRCPKPANFSCYMPFLCMESPLVELDLSACPWETPGFKHLLEALPTSKRELRSLSLKFCGLRQGEGPKGLLLLPLAKMPKLLQLNLRNNPLDDDVLVPFLLALRQNPTIQYLGLKNTHGQHRTRDALANLLERSTLIWVDIEANRIETDDFLKPLELALEKNTSLLRLDVPWSKAGPCRDRLNEYLKRNRANTVATSMKRGLHLILQSMGPGLPGIPTDLVDHLIETNDWTKEDARALSSLNSETWALRPKSLEPDGASK